MAVATDVVEKDACPETVRRRKEKAKEEKEAKEATQVKEAKVD